MSTERSSGSPRLVIDTATRQSTIGLGDGSLMLADSAWRTEHRHGSLLLAQLDEVLSRAAVDRTHITAIGIGTGPGSFTGLRVGMATAKTLAYALGCPIVGISTGDAIARAVADAEGTHTSQYVVILPAGASDHYVAVPGRDPQLVAPGTDLPALAGGRMAVTIDVAGSDLGEAAAARGAQALRGLAAAMLKLLDARLESSRADDVVTLVPTYVALPRGVTRALAEIEWSPDLR